jgi:O-methyltransferase
MKGIIKILVLWLTRTRLLTFPRRLFANAVLFAMESEGKVVISYSDHDRRKVLDLIRSIKREIPMLLDDNEAYQVYMAVKRTKKIHGDLAEVGVYKGGSGKLICKANTEKLLHLFDTFEGIPEVNEIDKSLFYTGQFSSSFEEVKYSLKEYKNVRFYRGLFPETARSVEDKKFSFIHLDVDTYQSTLSCLQFFYTRMNRGGIIISHDYINADGVRKAFDEFFEDKLEPIIEMSGTQCLIVKL